MKKIFFSLLILIPVFAIGQKIKIKDGILFLDDNKVAMLDDDTRHFYKFSTLAGKKVFDVTFKGMSASNLEGFQWLEITSADGKTTEIPYEVLMTSFSSTKLVVKLLSSKYELMDASGLNMENINAFFAQEREVLSDKYAKAVVYANNDAAEREKTVGQFNPFVKDDGTILFGGPSGTQIVGKVYYSKNPESYTVTDLDGITVAVASGCTTCTETKVKTYTDEEFSYDYGSRTMMQGRFSASQAKLLIDELVGRNYKLGREAKIKGKQLRNERVAIAKENSVNLYGVAGSVTDDEGVVYNGTIYAVFEKLIIDDSQRVNGMEDLDAVDNYGKNVSIEYNNEKGKTRIKKLKAKDDVSFCTLIDGEMSCFYGMKTKGNSLKKLTNAMNFGFDNSYFYREIKEVNGHQLLVKPGEEDLFVIKFKNKDVGFMIDGRDNESISEAFAKFIMDDCKSLATDLMNNEFDLNNKENLITILEEYNTCK